MHHFVVYRHIDSKTYERERERVEKPFLHFYGLKASRKRFSSVRCVPTFATEPCWTWESGTICWQASDSRTCLRQLLKTFFWALKLHFRNTVVTLFTIPSMGQLLCLWFFNTGRLVYILPLQSQWMFGYYLPVQMTMCLIVLDMQVQPQTGEDFLGNQSV